MYQTLLNSVSYPIIRFLFWLNIYWTSLTFIEPHCDHSDCLEKKYRHLSLHGNNSFRRYNKFLSTLVYFGGLRQPVRF